MLTLAGIVFILCFVFAIHLFHRHYSTKIQVNNKTEFSIGGFNTNLKVKIIDAKDIDFTVLQNFPHASVDFKNIKVMEVVESKNKDTLFKAGKVSFFFNLIDIFNKNYHLKKIRMDDLSIKIKINKNGKDNYHFWKTSSVKDSTSFSFALENVELNKIEVSYIDNSTNKRQLLWEFILEIKSSKLSYGPFFSRSISIVCAVDCSRDLMCINPRNTSLP